VPFPALSPLGLEVLRLNLEIRQKVEAKSNPQRILRGDILRKWRVKMMAKF